MLNKLHGASMLAALMLLPGVAAAQQSLLAAEAQTDAPAQQVSAQPRTEDIAFSLELPEAPAPHLASTPALAAAQQEKSFNTPFLMSSVSTSASSLGQDMFDQEMFASSASSSAAEFFGTAAIRPAPTTERVPLSQCPYDHTHARECRVHWRDEIIDGFTYLSFQNIGNLYTGFWYRWETTHGKWWDRYVNSVEGWRWRRWSDGNPFLDDYVGHSMQGAITTFIWVENDPKGMTLLQSNTKEYWRSRFRALLYSTALSFEWKLGPYGEAGIGHNGDHYFYEETDSSKMTNETGDVELVTTPVGGLLWSLLEDRLDQSVVARLENKSRNPLALIGYQFLTPARATANIFRFRAPWYRDTRQVHATGLFHTETYPEFAGPAVAGGSFVTRPAASQLPQPAPGFGGNYEFGAMLGTSWRHDTALGSNEDNRYMDIIVRGSGLLHASDSGRIALRYSPEVIAAAMLDEPTGGTGLEDQRKRTYGTGISPEGLQFVFRPTERVQPYLDEHAGLIYFFKPVLTPTGDRWVYNANFGGGVNILRKNGTSFTFGYRLQHLGPAQGKQQYGTDAHTFYIATSRFFRHRAQVY